MHKSSVAITDLAPHELLSNFVVVDIEYNDDEVAQVKRGGQSIGTMTRLNIAPPGEPEQVRWFGKSNRPQLLTGQAHPTQSQAVADLVAWAEGKDPAPYIKHAVLVNLMAPQTGADLTLLPAPWTGEKLNKLLDLVIQEGASLRTGSPSDATIGNEQLADIAQNYIPKLVELAYQQAMHTAYLRSQMAEQTAKYEGRLNLLRGKLASIRAMATRGVPNCINLFTIDRILDQPA